MGKGKADGVGFLRKVVGLPSRSGRARNPPPGYLTMTPHREVEGEVPLEEEEAGEEEEEEEEVGEGEAGEEEGGGGDDGGDGKGVDKKGWLRGNAKLPKQVPATEEQKWLIEPTGKE